MSGEAYIYTYVSALAIYPNALPCYLTIPSVPELPSTIVQLHPLLQPLPEASPPVFPSFWSPGTRQPRGTHAVQFPHHFSSGRGPTALTH